MNETIYKIALAGLLHDIGKFMQRAELEKEFIEIKNNYDGFCPTGNGGQYSHLHAAHTAFFIDKFIPENIIDKRVKTELYNAARHHINAADDIYVAADHLSSGMERSEDEKDTEGYKQVRLHSIFDAVELQYSIYDKANLNSRWRYQLIGLSENNSAKLFPVMGDDAGKMPDNDLTYRELWDKFKEELEIINKQGDLVTYFNRLYWLLEKYTWCIPSATNVYPDISLFDHLKTTASIATCFYYREQEIKKNKSDFLLYAGDISGIQDYIFRITQGQGVGGISKRLRGRSFYITMVAEVLSRYIVNSLDLTIANINLCGGGNFEILLPNTKRVAEFLAGFKIEVNEWLFAEFTGSLGFVDSMVEMGAEELRLKYGMKKDQLAEQLQIAKLQRSQMHFDKETFWIDKTEIDGKIKVCPSCNLRLIPDNETEGVCGFCRQDQQIGQLLPKSKCLIFSSVPYYSDGSEYNINLGKFGSVILLDRDIPINKSLSEEASLYSLVDTDLNPLPQYFLAKTLPVAEAYMELETERDTENDGEVRPGQTLSFATLADMAQGDKRIGILKMDVDNLGLIFSLGLDMTTPQGQKIGNFKSISRLSTLSRSLSMFFSLYVDISCKKIFQEWQKDAKNTWTDKMKVSNIFYLIFSGGDDLVIVGPWDRVIDLARDIRKSFKIITCHNPNITLSAGIYICKPKFPISIAVEKAKEALEQAKHNGKNRLTVMGETFVWDKEDARSRVFQPELQDSYPGRLFDEIENLSEHIYIAGVSEKESRPNKTLTFEDLYRFANLLHEYYEEECISRGFISMLLNAKEKFFRSIYNERRDRFEEDQNLMILPHMLYNIERNASGSVKEEFKKILVSTGEAQKYMRQAYYPCKSVLMKTKY
ncbi:MAG: type III-A CRISPR-associated protein Cas10/Csm1 [Deltaproteobacteria bacterium]|nr:type III-A CRISPR-associated protein Cas10/Csm1 [Deltaproteobacteria bacterium]